MVAAECPVPKRKRWTKRFRSSPTDVEPGAERKIIGMLDVLSLEVVSLRQDVAGLRDDNGEIKRDIGALRAEMSSGFDRLDRRMGRLETRVETLETGLRG